MYDVLTGSDQTLRAVFGTTTSVNIIEGGFKQNVVPTTARAVINHRIAPYHKIVLLSSILYL